MFGSDQRVPPRHMPGRGAVSSLRSRFTSQWRRVYLWKQFLPPSLDYLRPNTKFQTKSSLNAHPSTCFCQNTRGWGTFPWWCAASGPAWSKWSGSHLPLRYEGPSAPCCEMNYSKLVVLQRKHCVNILVWNNKLWPKNSPNHENHVVIISVNSWFTVSTWSGRVWFADANDSTPYRYMPTSHAWTISHE